MLQQRQVDSSHDPGRGVRASKVQYALVRTRRATDYEPPIPEKPLC